MVIAVLIALLVGGEDDQPTTTGADAAVEVVLVSTGQAEERGNWPPSEWLDDEGWARPVLVDDDSATAAEAYGLSGFPYFVMVDAEGLVTERASGALGPDAVLAMIERAVAQ